MLSAHFAGRPILCKCFDFIVLCEFMFKYKKNSTSCLNSKLYTVIALNNLS